MDVRVLNVEFMADRVTRTESGIISEQFDPSPDDTPYRGGAATHQPRQRPVCNPRAPAVQIAVFTQATRRAKRQRVNQHDRDSRQRNPKTPPELLMAIGNPNRQPDNKCRKGNRTSRIN